METLRAEIAIVGSGFAGSILARALRARGREVLLLERGSHPRFALGESSTPLAAIALERLAADYGLEDLRHLATYGRWAEHLPELRRGLKRGFTFYRHHPGRPYANGADNESRLLVAASPEDRLADLHWLRQDVDHHLVRKAVEEGVAYRDRLHLEAIHEAGTGWRLTGSRHGEPWSTEVSFVVDASGGRGFLSQALALPDRPAAPLPTSAVCAHLEGLEPFVEVAARHGARLDEGPFPDERAAVHHWIDEGWIYALPFDHGVTSVGLLLADGAAREVVQEVETDPAAVWRRVLGRYPTLDEHFSGGELAQPWIGLPRAAHRRWRAAGPCWALLPSTFAFTDPLFSTGIAWSLLGVERLAGMLEEGPPDPETLEAYATLLDREADQIERLVSGAYAARRRFPLFAAYALLYFAVASFAEASQRLKAEVRAWAWDGFLGADDPWIQRLLAEASARLGDPGVEARDFRRWLLAALRPRDIAGLGHPVAPNLYAVDLDPLIAGAPLLGLTPEEVRAAIPRLLA